MRHLSLLFFFCFAISTSFAGEQFHLDAEIMEDGGVLLRWERQYKPSFWGYRVVRSYSDANPYYHSSSSIEWYEERDHNTHPDYPREEAPVVYYRICALAKGYDKNKPEYLCYSNVVTIKGQKISGAIPVKYVPPPNDGCGPCEDEHSEESGEQALSFVNAGGPRFLFIHHSCGENWLRDGLRQLLEKEGFQVGHATYGDGVVGEATDPCDWPEKFGQNMKKVLSFGLPKGENYEVVMFKSCFPASNIESDEQTAEYKRYFNQIGKAFRKENKVFFIACTAPPLVPNESSRANAKRARRFNNWLKNEWAPQFLNVAVFDFYGVLSDNKGFLRKPYRVDEYDSHPATLGNKAATKKFVPFIGKVKKRLKSLK